jgi:arginyl-tRNA synthetase
MIRSRIEKEIKATLAELGIGLSSNISLEHPVDLSNGDYATSVALALAKQTGKNSKALAEEIVAHFPAMPEIAKIETAGPGFINFYLSRDFFTNATKEINNDADLWGKNAQNAAARVTIEYTDPNPFKPFHIGHLMTNVIGESIARLYEYSGAVVTRANYQGDVGLHVAKAIWGMKEKGSNPSNINEIGEAYAYGADKYETDPDAKSKIDALNKIIYERSDVEINALYDAGKKTSLERFEEIYALLGTKFDEYFFESETALMGKQVVEDGLTKGIFEKSDGAVVYHGEEDGLHTRVFMNSLGLPTYEAKELGLAKLKYERSPYDLSIIITANEIKEYFKVLLSVMQKLFPELAKKTMHVTHGFMRLQSGKMSSRKGNVITGESLIEEVRVAALEKMKGRELAEKETIADIVAVAAIKYSILRQNAGKDIVFDPEQSLSLDGDSGPYLQYAHTRALSILEKAKKENVAQDTKNAPEHVAEIERLLYRFPEVVMRAASEYEPHFVATYLTELASTFNGWYANEQIVNASDPASAYKVAMTDAFHITMRNGLFLLGIRVPEKM